MGAASRRECLRMNETAQSSGSKSLRKGRVSSVGQTYLITSTIHNRAELLKDKQLNSIVAGALRWLHDNNRIELLAYVIMPDHLHFIAILRTGSLSELMQSLKSYTAKKINGILQRKGKLWQDQYHDHALRKEEDLKDVVYYCLNNPVRKRMVEDYRDYPYWYCKWKI